MPGAKKSKQWYEEEYVKSAMDPVYCAGNYARVMNKLAGGYVPFELFDPQIRVLNGFIEHDYNLVSKYRQAGISTTSAFFVAHRINFTPDFKVAIVANKLETARDEIFKKAVDFIEGFPDWMKVKPTKKDKENYKVFSNGSAIKAVAAGKQGLRGYSPNLILMDEAAFFDFGYEFYTAARGSLSSGGGAIMVSTPNGLDRLYYATYKNAKEGKNDYNIVEIRWYEDPRYNVDLAWEKGDSRIETKDPKIYNELIKQGYKPTSSWYLEQCAGYDWDEKRISAELDNSFLGSGNNFFPEKVMTRQETKNVKEPIYKEHDDATWIWEDPIEGEKYIMGIDVSLGTSTDYSTISIIRVHESHMEQVAEFQGKVPPDMLGSIGYELGMRYNAYAAVDITGGLGITTVGVMFELGYPKKLMHHSEIRSPELRDRLSEHNPGSSHLPGFSIGVNRPLMLNEFEKLVRMDEFVIRSIRMIGEMKTFIVKENHKAEHRRGFTDDLIFANVMPVYAYKFNASKVESAERTKRMLEAMQVSTQKDQPVSGGGDIRNPFAAARSLGSRSSAAQAQRYNWLFKK